MPNSPPETRASLILRLRNADDMAAWEEFAGLYGPVVFRVARRRGLQAADAENLVQEVLLAVAQSVSRWIDRDDRGSFHAWLLRIAHNEAINMLLQRATRALGQDGARGHQLLKEVSIRNDISSLIDREYERELFRRAADRVQQVVSPSTWQAFWLTEVDGHTVQQAAETLGTSMGHIYVSRSRVMARIKELVQEYEVRT
ncbi:MAG: sigma-70 family RNA polymerase sigma factor [Pirellulaceae bacterium]